MSKSTSKSNSKHTTTRTSNRKSNGGSSGRPRPVAPKAGVTKKRTRYEEGGGWCW